jgi:hypothetical protein
VLQLFVLQLTRHQDVLACVGIMVVANKVGNYFDVHLKRSKWLSDIILNVGVAVREPVDLLLGT